VEIVLGIIVFIAVCAALMFWDYYKPARFRTSYRNVAKKGSDRGGLFLSGDSDGGGDGGGGD